MTKKMAGALIAACVVSAAWAKDPPPKEDPLSQAYGEAQQVAIPAGLGLAAEPAQPHAVAKTAKKQGVCVVNFTSPIEAALVYPQDAKAEEEGIVITQKSDTQVEIRVETPDRDSPPEGERLVRVRERGGKGRTVRDFLVTARNGGGEVLIGASKDGTPGKFRRENPNPTGFLGMSNDMLYLSEGITMTTDLTKGMSWGLFGMSGGHTVSISCQYPAAN